MRAEVAIQWRFGAASSMRQTVRLDAGSARLEFHCDADWHEQHTLLKVLFPVAVRSPNATYQMQFGHTQQHHPYSTATTWPGTRCRVIASPICRNMDLASHF